MLWKRLKRRKESTTTAYIGLGANLGDRERTIRRALEAIDASPDASLLLVSTLRETDPVGIVDQPAFLNGVAMIGTTAPARRLLDSLLDLERRLGRDRTTSPPGGPRTIDLDLLLYGDETIEEPGLQVPHPRLHERRFVLEPLAELSPRLVIPGRGRVSTLLAELR
ncbi:MAG TPA: 2-amino-4-hydroxy-6-hydroxymethyldihydropteridine diphosphokinase [Gaiellaceae bacterium]|nr:2-amino-4-hydroxy-6-hydroxymethyldihydropteridine diphosphokinase [Gaiellaceae bacterium]